VFFSPKYAIENPSLNGRASITALNYKTSKLKCCLSIILPVPIFCCELCRPTNQKMKKNQKKSEMARKKMAEMSNLAAKYLLPILMIFCFAMGLIILFKKVL
jgi:hypothetical protein